MYTLNRRLRAANRLSWKGAAMDREEALLVLKDMLEESDDTARMLPDRRLEMLLDETDGDVRRAAYLGALL